MSRASDAKTEYCGEFVHEGQKWCLNIFAVDDDDAFRKAEGVRESFKIVGILRATIDAGPDAVPQPDEQQRIVLSAETAEAIRTAVLTAAANGHQVGGLACALIDELKQVKVACGPVQGTFLLGQSAALK